MILKIKKEAFKDLPVGTHSLKVNFNDGHATGTFEVGNKISFTIIDTVFTATAGQTWGDWIASFNIGTSGNNIIWVSQNAQGCQLYLDCRNYPNWSQGVSLGSEEDALYDSNDVRQTLSTEIINGAIYGRSSDAPC